MSCVEQDGIIACDDRDVRIGARRSRKPSCTILYSLIKSGLFSFQEKQIYGWFSKSDPRFASHHGNWPKRCYERATGVAKRAILVRRPRLCDLSQAVKELAALPEGSRAIVSICADGGEGTVALLENS